MPNPLPSPALLYAAGLGAVALILLVPLRLMMKRRRLLLDTPTSQAAGVTLGLTELKGLAEECVPLRSFLAEVAAVHYAYTVEEHWRRVVIETHSDEKGGTFTRTRIESGWTTVGQGGARVPFWLRDDSGRIRILPDGAKIEPRCIFRQYCTPSSDLYHGKGPPCAIPDSTLERRFTENAITPGDRLHVMGQVRARQEVAEPEVAADPHADLFLISIRSEEQIVAGYGWLVAGCGFLGFTLAAGAALPFELCAGVEFGTAVEHQSGWMLLNLAVYAMPVAGLYAAGLYNGLIRLRERVKRAWAMVEVELQRRADLIPSLAEAVKAYAAHETRVQEAVASLRLAPPPHAGHPPTEAQVQAGMQAARHQAAAAGHLLAIAENYPPLKASDLFRRLTAHLTDTENRLALGRAFFNASAELHNARLLRFPDRLFTRLGGFAPVAYCEAAQGEKAAVKVAFPSAGAPAGLPFAATPRK